MLKPEIPHDESRRLAALHQLKILDTSAEERFDRLTRLARHISGAPIALISLVDANRQWFKSKQGLDACETPREISFCGHAILQDGIFYIPRALEDDRFSDNPLVTGPPNIRSYAGAPLFAEDGSRLGTLCVIDTENTQYTAEQLDSLRDLADCVQAEMQQQSVIDMSLALRQQDEELKDTLSHLDKHINLLTDVHSVTTQVNVPFDDKINALLKLGREFFNMQLAIVSRVDGQRYIVKYADALEDPPPAGTEFELGNTYCFHALKAEKPIGFHHVAESEIRTHPCYEAFGLESYIGTPIMVNDQRYGTLNFSSLSPRETPFTQEDYTLITLIGEWVSHELESIENIRTLTRAKEEAERHSKAKSEFLNVMSHELRTPLTVILGYLPMLRDADKLPPAEMIAEFSRDMDTAGHQLMAMINDLLDISKIEADRLELKPEEIDLRQLIGDIVRSVESLAREADIELITDIRIEKIHADPVRLKQIIYNLLSNAIKFTKSGSVTISCISNEGGMLVSVKDTGVGIPSQQLSKIFEKFHQIDSSSTRATRGTGLGLAITKKLIELHGGKIEVESEVNQGTCFTFTINEQKG